MCIFFEMPVTLQLTASNGDKENIVLNHTENQQEFIIDVSITDVQDIVVDPFADIITKEHTVTISESEALQLDELVVFPNPATDSFQVLFPKI